MIERTIIGAAVMGLVGFGLSCGLLHAGWGEASARNTLLLLMVLFENIHIGNCRSETKSALLLSPLRTPILLVGALVAFFVHVGALYLPLAREVLQTEPLNLATWGMLLALTLTVFVAIEVHKWTWALRQRAAAISSPTATTAGSPLRSALSTASTSITSCIDRAGDGRQQPDGGQQHADHAQRHAADGALQGDRSHARGRCAGTRPPSAARLHDHGAGGLGGDVAVLAEGDADGRGRQRRGVVDAVAQEDGVGPLRSRARTSASFCSGRLARRTPP